MLQLRVIQGTNLLLLQLQHALKALQRLHNTRSKEADINIRQLQLPLLTQLVICCQCPGSSCQDPIILLSCI